MAIPSANPRPAPAPNPHTHTTRLHAAYARLTFKSNPTVHHDVRREELFQRLVQHHLLQSNMYTLQDWLELEAQQRCTYRFLQAYAKQLWPGKASERGHLAHANLRGKARSFVGAIDMHWSARNGNRKAKEVGLGVESYVGSSALSRIGRVFEGYVNVLLEPALTGANVEDVERLLEGITCVEMGPDIPVVVVQQLVSEDEDEGGEELDDGEGGEELDDGEGGEELDDGEPGEGFEHAEASEVEENNL